jgi:hypothetical protein
MMWYRSSIEFVRCLGNAITVCDRSPRRSHQARTGSGYASFALVGPQPDRALHTIVTRHDRTSPTREAEKKKELHDVGEVVYQNPRENLTEP